MFEEILRESVRTSDLDEAVTGWGGDMYVTWADASGKTCLRDTFVGDTPEDTQQLADALDGGRRRAGHRDRAPGQPGTFTVCS